MLLVLKGRDEYSVDGRSAIRGDLLEMPAVVGPSVEGIPDISGPVGVSKVLLISGIEHRDEDVAHRRVPVRIDLLKLPAIVRLPEEGIPNISGPGPPRLSANTPNWQTPISSLDIVSVLEHLWWRHRQFFLLCRDGDPICLLTVYLYYCISTEC